MGTDSALISIDYDRVIRNALAAQLCVGFIAALMLDGGVISKVVGTSVLAFWCCVAFLVLKRRNHPTQVDLAFVQWGFWLILAAAAFRQGLAA